jgi:chromate reductase
VSGGRPLKEERVRILALSGSRRDASWSSALPRAARDLAPRGSVVDIHEGHKAWPLFDPDREADPPVPVLALRALVGDADALLIASPEYAHGVTGTIKNTLDWLVSHPDFAGKPVAVFNPSLRAGHADAALKETLRTMAADLVDAASVRVPVIGAPIALDAIAATPTFRGPIESALDTLAAHVRARRVSEGCLPSYYALHLHRSRYTTACLLALSPIGWQTILESPPWGRRGHARGLFFCLLPCNVHERQDDPMKAALAFLPLAMPQAARVLQQFRKDAGWTGTTDAAMAEALQPGSHVQWVPVRAGQKTVALARMELAPPQFCFVSDLIVLSGWRGRGVGEWIMRRIEQACLAHGIPRVVLQALAPSRGFYEKLHFVDDPLATGFLKKELNPLQRRVGVALR